MRFVRNTGREGPSLALAAMVATLLVWGCSSATDPGGGPGDPPANNPPTASAGPDLAVSVGLGVTVDGSASSDADGDPITWLWTLTAPSGSGASLDDATISKPSFVPDVEGAYVLSLKVNDGEAESAADQATVTATDNTVASAIVAADGGSMASSDGALALTVPAGALASDTEISVTLVSDAQRPASIADIPGDVKVYDMGPDGTTFSTPVEVAFDVPGAVTQSATEVVMKGLLLLSESDGVVEPMTGVTLVQDDGDPTQVSASGGLSHFSYAILADPGVTVRIVAPSTAEIDTPFDVTVSVDVTGAGIGGIRSAATEDFSEEFVAPVGDFLQDLTGTIYQVTVTNSYQCQSAAETRIRQVVTLDVTEAFGSVSTITLSKGISCIAPPPPLVTTPIPDLYRVQRLLPIPGSDEEITTGGLVRRVNLASGAVTEMSEASSDYPEWVFSLSDGNYLVYPVTGYNPKWFVPNGDPLTDTMFVTWFDQPRHMAPVSENTVALASAAGDLGFITYTPGGASGSFQDAFRNLESQTNPQQDPLTNLQAIWVSPDAQTFIGAVTEGDGDSAFENTQAALIDANVGTGEISVTLLPGIIDFIIDYDVRHQFDLECGALEGGLPSELLCVFTSGFDSPKSTSPLVDVEGDGYVVIFIVDTFDRSSRLVYWDYGNGRVGAGVFPFAGGTTGVAVANQFTGDLDVWHVTGREISAQFPVSLGDQCEAPTDMILLAFGARGALACQGASAPTDFLLMIENLDLQLPPVS